MTSLALQRKDVRRPDVLATAVYPASIPFHRPGTRIVTMLALVAPLLIGAIASGTALVDDAPPSVQDTGGDKKDATSENLPPEHLIIEGQVTDYVGSGHADVTVTVRTNVDDGLGMTIATVTTDDLGDFQVRVARPIHGDVVVTIEKTAYATIVRELHLGDEETPAFVDAELIGNLVVIGKVLDALTDEPIAGATVDLTAHFEEWSESTNERGEFTIKSVTPGPGDLVIEAKGYGREKQRVQRLEEFGELIVTLKPERTVTLRVFDETGRPIRGAAVECYDRPRDDLRNVVTDKNGGVTLRGIHFDARALGIRLSHEDHVSSQDFDRTIVLPAENNASTHKLGMIRAGRLAGTVTDKATGAPLGGARLIVGTVYSDLTPRDWTTFEGKYTVVGVPPGKAVVTIHLAGYAPDLRIVEVAVGEVAKLNLAMESPAVVRGVVRNQDDEPVAGALVDAVQWRGYQTLGLRAVTDEQGVFVIEGAPRDSFDVAIAVGRQEPVVRSIQAGGVKPIELAITVDEGAAAGQIAATVKLGDPAPPLTLTTTTGMTLSPTSHRNKTTLVQFWATWCPPCVAEIPQLQAVWKDFGARKDFAMVGISLDTDEKALADFMAKQKIKWPIAAGKAGGANKAADLYGVSAIPAIFLIGPDGKVVRTQLRGSELHDAVKRVLDQHDGTS